MCVDRGFADWFGLSAADCLGKGFPSLAVDPDPLQGCVLQLHDACNCMRMACLV